MSIKRVYEFRFENFFFNGLNSPTIVLSTNFNSFNKQHKCLNLEKKTLFQYKTQLNRYRCYQLKS